MQLHLKEEPGQLDRKGRVIENSERHAAMRRQWRARASFFHEEDNRYLRYLIPKASRVLEVGCGAGDTLAALEPSYGLGIDISPSMVDVARRCHPHLEFHVGDIEFPQTLRTIEGQFDFILIVDTLGLLDDCQAALENLHHLCTRETRLIIVYYSHLWQPILKAAEMLKLRMPQVDTNILSPGDVRAISALSDFDPVSSEQRVLSPLRLLGLGRALNRFVSTLPLIRHLALRHYVVCRSWRKVADNLTSATVVIPARNERGNIEQAVLRLCNFCSDIEIIFVEGHSSDGTFEEMERVQAAYPDHDIKVMRQPGKGKADAVFTAFDVARGDVLIILDADLTVPPEQLGKFWDALRAGKGEFINGTRLVYPMEQQAMRFLNLAANKIFSAIFTWLLNQRFTDTLCGTKVMRRSDYVRLKNSREYFGKFDPFGDFDLIFGSAKLSLKCIEVPIRYASRRYGVTQISRFRHGLILLRMVVFAFFKIKAM